MEAFSARIFGLRIRVILLFLLFNVLGFEILSLQ